MVAGLATSLYYAGATVVIALLLGSGWAMVEYLWSYQASRWRLGFFTWLIFLPPLYISSALIATFGTAGLFPSQILYTPVAVLVAMVYFNVPLAYLFTYSALNNLPPSLITSARILGAKRWKIFTSIVLPYLRRPLWGIASLILLYSFTSYVLPLTLGGKYGQTSEVWLQQTVFIYHDYTLATIFVIGQFIIFTGLLLMSQTLFKSIATSTSLSPSPAPSSAPSVIHYFSLCSAILTFLFLAPLAALALRIISQTSMSDLNQLLAGPFISSLGRTLIIMLLVQALSLGLVLLLRLKTSFGLVLLAISPLSLAFIWYQLFGRSYLSVGGALIMLTLPICIIIIHQAREQQANYLLNTARVLGANVWQQLWTELKLLGPAVRLALAASGVLVLGDVSISAQLAPAGKPLLLPSAQLLISSYRFGVGGLALLVGAALMCLTVMVIYAYRPKS